MLQRRRESDAIVKRSEGLPKQKSESKAMKHNPELILSLTERLVEACDGDHDMVRAMVDDVLVRREKFRQEVVEMARQLFRGKTAPLPMIAGTVSTAIHAPYEKVQKVIRQEFVVKRRAGVQVF
jgi:hypothetical protein